MPPRKGIVKSGNAGNSSKASNEPPPAPVPDAEKPLFPPGSKFPLSLLHERCQKNGWEKPQVDSRKLGDGWTFTVTLRRRANKKTTETESVHLTPHPPYKRPNALEARHWGATYALYRFCNGIQLNRILPPGPREYWNELAEEHKKAPGHQRWMYDADPFAAKKEVEARQEQATKRREDSHRASDDPRAKSKTSSEFDHAPEVRMASSLRELVEESIKQATSLYPEARSDGSGLASEDTSTTTTQLGLLGFNAQQIRKAIEFLSQPSALADNLLSTLTHLEASIEYLLLHLPECDLPKRFLPSNNSSNPFITSAHAGTTDLKKRWIEEKAIKEAGWPEHVVKASTVDTRILDDWALLIAALGQKLIGEDVDTLFDNGSQHDPFPLDEEEITALGARFEDSTTIVMPLFSAPIELHIITSPEKSYPRPAFTPLYITSTSVPAYIRLHLLSSLLRAMQDPEFIEPGEQLCMAAMRVLENEWALIEEQGPPDMSTVLQHIAPRPSVVEATYIQGSHPTKVSAGYRGARAGPNKQTDVQVKSNFDAMTRNPKYAEMYAARKKLPAFLAKDAFLDMLRSNKAVVVVGETGCGKTTQLPQFVLDELITSGQGSKASIIVTQPRRISAISVAARVSAERLEDGLVGYTIRGENKTDWRTKLRFCTTGVLLRRLGSGDKLESVTHVIVDEVHERSVEGDFLLLELKELLKHHPTLKVILMSATINHETFVKYFGGAPLLTIPGFTHPVSDKYLEDVMPHLNFSLAAKAGRNDRNGEAAVERLKQQGVGDDDIRTINALMKDGRINYQLVAAVVKHIVSGSPERSGILIFLPGVQEIRSCIEAIRDAIPSSSADILPLHANLSSDEQNRVFAATKRWKIIAATNVAETSITIDDVVYVIDAGRVKETHYDSETGLSRLLETWVTQAAARQRRGRAGRTKPGVCYKLYTRTVHDQMHKFPIPEIMRVPLESISLTVKVTRENEDVKYFLSKAIDPPKDTAMDKAWSTLEELGAVDESGKLTALGRQISMLPVDVRLAKMLVLGTIFQCLDPILTIVASLSSKPLFTSPMDKREEANQARLRLSYGNSDIMTDLNAYSEVIKLRGSNKAMEAFCDQNFISATTVREITTLRNEFVGVLADMGFIPLKLLPSDPAMNSNSSNTNLVKAIVLGGLWPRVARVHLPKGAIKFDKVQAGTVQRENTAKEYKMYDIRGPRVFLHPASVLFGASAWKSPFLVYFHQYETSKVFLRDATEVPMYALLLFGGAVSVNLVGGGVTIGKQGEQLRLKAWPRIGVLVNQLRRLLDILLQRCVEDGAMLNVGHDNPVAKAMLALLTNDGLSE
ncbi:hypothetical protein HGRIS_008336 [Hohenbuehelia grisea]|uniref:P-loop containing nucleoside triphosphate hydrolase protein n=1 Tax=Hohenbuehelia grisea TaxID=104357 RepID=A0ABR3J8N8_9AGAR